VLTFRSQDLDKTRNTLGQLAYAFADKFNAQHKQGYDVDGDQGTDFFTIGTPSTLSNAKNTGTGALTATSVTAPGAGDGLQTD
jgi:flagellar hook-associated protein 1 FlgK